jgi:hypothetical protein
MDIVLRAFRTSLIKGHAAERRWVELIRSAGKSAAHGRKLVIAQHNKNTDHVESPDAIGLVSLEIKERSLRFSSPEDYPYDTVIVDDLRGLGRERLKHLAYVYISRPTGCWVWLSSLDRDESWKAQVTFDRGRGHQVPCLYAPKAHLRPAQELLDLLYPHSHLDLVDGNTTMFLHGGGETESRERYVAKEDRRA